MKLQAAQLAGWAPIRVYWRGQEAMVDWCHLGGLRFSAPFFEQTIHEALCRPFGLIFRHQTSLEELIDLHSDRPGLDPAGFIFHMSRCGSTLVSQMLAAAPENIVISEAGPIDFVLRAQSPGAVLSEAQRIQWLRGVVSALARPQGLRDKHCFIKFDAWHVLQLPLIRSAFPAVPWIFLYRDPAEVMVSHRREPGGQTVPGVLHPQLFGLDTISVGMIPPDEYCARVLGKILESALAHAGEQHSRLVNYKQLPNAFAPGLLDFFGVSYPDHTIERMRGVAHYNAKAPAFPFDRDSAQKQHEADDRIRQLTGQWLAPTYERLETARKQGAAVNAKSNRGPG